MIKLKKHQQAVVNKNKKHYLIPFETGVGKTHAIMGLLLKNKPQNALLICIKADKAKWEEHNKAYNLNIDIYTKEEFRKIATKTVIRKVFNTNLQERVEVKQIVPAPEKVKQYEAVIFDEVHFALGLKSLLHKSFYRYIKHHKPKYLWLATATPYPNNPWNLYALARLFGQEWNYKLFQKHFYNMVQMGGRIIPKLKTYINGVPLQDEIAKYIKLFGDPVKIEDVSDMPGKILKVEYFKLTREQQKLYDSVQEDLVLTRNLRKHQICGGINGDEMIKTNKLKRLIELCEIHQKIFIVANYQKEVEFIRDTLAKKFKREIIVFTGKNSAQRKVDSDRTDKLNSCIVIANAACSTAYETKTIPIMVFYSYNYSLTNYIQIIGRIRRINKPEPRTYISLIIKDTIDEAVYRAIERKKSFDFKIYNKN